MCGSILLGVLLGALTLKMARRWAYWRYSGGGCGAGHGMGPGCGHGGRRFLYYRWGHHGHGGRGYYNGNGEEAAWGGRGGGRPAGKSIGEVVRGLDLNERQRQEATPVLALAQEWLGPAGPRIEAALLAVAADRFEPVLVEGLLDGADVPAGVRRELVEGLEHLHTILISEQREQLRTALSRSGKPNPPPSSTSGEGGTPAANV